MPKAIHGETREGLASRDDAASFTSLESQVSRSGLRDERFWLSYFRTSFIVFIGELAAGLAYFCLTPNGPHREALIVVNLITIGVALGGLYGVPHVVPLKWRADILVAWILFAGIVITLTAFLDLGINSPLIVLFVLPLAATALGTSVRNVIVCGAATLAELTFVWFTDPIKSSAVSDAALLAATVVGMAVFAVGITMARSRMHNEQILLEGELTSRAEKDSLTGCLNHGSFYERLGLEIDRSYRERQPLSLLMVDVDLFKSFNDAYGHVAGDDALARIGGVFRNLSRSFDLVGRVGGDEFAIVLPNTSASDALTIAQRMKMCIARECTPITVSIGTATTLEHEALTPTQLVRNADANLYGAKTNGRNQVVQSNRGETALGGGSNHQSERGNADVWVAEEGAGDSSRPK